ncbi:MAG: biopolymer transporter ExbD [Opitutae bacterium]|nr:biopolymer transporter ExbD [Opitutae bacterium]MBT4665241.1 biopolymer transporter ExbD [Opitutae bacterium]MBT5908243.1 biopolymer transporter ExbD [Opitutae bacterium]MBT6852540.1 biopolymer transporter ExbD [Opitutae bacterium]MBT7742002.1 biopolymer transporter ExbD [Opitutae bacterium]
MRKSQRKKRRSVPVPIASMGDIAFLLIIFFLVCSEVSKDKANVRVTLPESEKVEKMEATVVARIAVSEDGEIYFDGVRVDGAKDVEWGVRALLTNTVTDDQRHVQFKCDANLPKETFEPVLKAIAEAGGIIEAVGEKTN